MAFRYGPGARRLHWLIAALVLVLLVVGFWMTSFAPKNHRLNHLLYVVHESTGVVVFVLMLMRLAVRLQRPPAPLPDSIPSLFRFAGSANHLLLYALLLAQPVVGFVNTSAFGIRIVWAGLVPLPSPIGKDEALGELMSGLHWYIAWALLALIGAHLAAALFHGVIRRDGVVQRML